MFLERRKSDALVFFSEQKSDQRLANSLYAGHLKGTLVFKCPQLF